MEKRVPNSELHLIRLEEEAADLPEERGILELFDRDEDAPLSRDQSDPSDE